jgi:hypothetical protein
VIEPFFDASQVALQPTKEAISRKGVSTGSYWPGLCFLPFEPCLGCMEIRRQMRSPTSGLAESAQRLMESHKRTNRDSPVRAREVSTWKSTSSCCFPFALTQLTLVIDVDELQRLIPLRSLIGWHCAAKHSTIDRSAGAPEIHAGVCR